MDNAGWRAVANQNFDHVEPGVGRAPGLAHPGPGRAPERPALARVDREPTRPAPLGRAGLHLDEDEHLAFEEDEVELVATVPPIGGQAAGSLAAIMLLGMAFAHGAEIGGRRSADPPVPACLPEFGEKHVQGHPKADFYATS